MRRPFMHMWGCIGKGSKKHKTEERRGKKKQHVADLIFCFYETFCVFPRAIFVIYMIPHTLHAHKSKPE